MRYLLIALVLAVFVSVCALGCKAGDGEDCAKNEDCAASLTCHDFKCIGIEELKQLKAEKEEQERAEAKRREEQAKAEAKRREKQAKADAKRRGDMAFCSSKYRLDRRGNQESLCMDNGACSRDPTNGSCVVTNEKDCERSTKCGKSGECGHSVHVILNNIAYHHCAPRHHADCRSSMGCSQTRRCFLLDYGGRYMCGPKYAAAQDKSVSVVNTNPEWLKHSAAE